VPSSLVAALLGCGIAAGDPGAPAPPRGHADAASAMAVARAARASGDLRSARDWLAFAVESDPAWELPRVDLADLLLASDRGAGASNASVRLLEGAASTPSQNPRLYRLLGEARARLGQLSDAAAIWARGLALVDDPSLRLARAALLRELPGRLDEAIAEAERVRAARPRDPAPRSLLAEAYEAAGRRAEAEAELRWLAETSPSSAAAFRRLARFYARTNEEARAAEAERAARAAERPARPLRTLKPGA